jgi:hypothetical protein
MVLPRFWVNNARRETYIITLAQPELGEHVVRDGVGEVIAHKVEGREHDTAPDLGSDERRCNPP